MYGVHNGSGDVPSFFCLPKLTIFFFIGISCCLEGLADVEQGKHEDMEMETGVVMNMPYRSID